MQAGFSGSCLLEVWISPKLTIPQPFRATCCSTLVHSHYIMNNLFLIPSHNFLCCNICQLLFTLVPCTSEKKLGPSSLWSPNEELKKRIMSPFSSLFSRLHKGKSFSLSSYDAKLSQCWWFSDVFQTLKFYTSQSTSRTEQNWLMT